MHEVFNQHNVTLEQRQFLTEANILLLNRREDGSYPQEVIDATRFNLKTKVKEDGFANAVSHSFQPVGEYTTPDGETRRSLIQKGLGKTAVQIAESGFDYHWSEPAYDHVRYHVKEARRDEAELKPDKWHVMIEPKFTASDALPEIAKSEHMASTDAIRTSYAATDNEGNITGRHMTAILVSDIPIAAWVAMFRDKNNLWKQSFDIQNQDSSLGVMALFDQLDLPLESLPEGPITLVQAVLPYITNEKAQLIVEEQLIGLRQDQQKLDDEADYTAGEWIEFLKPLTESIITKTMHKDIKIFAMQLQQHWDEETLTVLKKHEKGSGYTMSVELAAILEEEWERINVGKAAIVIGDKKALENVTKENAEKMKNDILFIRTLQQGGAINAAEYAAATSRINHIIAKSDIKVGGGGCGPQLKSRFGKRRNSNNPEGLDHDLYISNPVEEDYDHSQYDDDTEEDSEGIGEVHFNQCRTGYCPSDDKVVKVGGCDVCLKWCQPVFNNGMDPSDVYAYRLRQKEQKPRFKSGILSLFGIKSIEMPKQPNKREVVAV